MSNRSQEYFLKVEIKVLNSESLKDLNKTVSINIFTFNISELKQIIKSNSTWTLSLLKINERHSIKFIEVAIYTYSV